MIQKVSEMAINMEWLRRSRGGQREKKVIFPLTKIIGGIGG